MAIKKDSVRIQMTLKRDFVDRLDAYCKRAGMSRSTWMEYTLTSALDSMDVMLDKMAEDAKEIAVQNVGE